MDVNSVDAVWTWLEGDFLNALYDGENEYNPMVSLPRLRMQRVRDDSCVVHEDFQDNVSVQIKIIYSSIRDFSTKITFLLPLTLTSCIF
jgi:hypothetical protein